MNNRAKNMKAYNDEHQIENVELNWENGQDSSYGATFSFPIVNGVPDN